MSKTEEDLYEMMADSVKSLAEKGWKTSVLLTVGDRTTHAASISTRKELNNLPIVYINIQSPEMSREIALKKNMVGRWHDLDVRKGIDFLRQMGGEPYVVMHLEPGHPIDSILKHKIRKSLTDTVRYRFNHDYSNPRTLPYVAKRDKNRTVIIPISLVDPKTNYTDSAHNIGFSYKQMFDCQGAHTTYLLVKSGFYSYLPFRSSLSRYYTMLPEQFNMTEPSYMSNCIGGYMTPYFKMAEEAESIIDSLAMGFPVQTLKSFPHKADYWIDWREYASEGMLASDLPDYINFVNLPWYQHDSFLKMIHDGGWKALSAIIFVMLVVWLILLRLAKNKEEEKLLNSGREAEQRMNDMTSALAITNSFIWQMDGDYIVLADNVLTELKLHRNRISLLAILRLIDDSNVRFKLSNALTSTDKIDDKTEMEVALSFAKGQKHYLYVNITHLLLKGKVTAMGTFFINDQMMEHQKKIRESLEAEEKSQMRESFLASMGHEIRTPINAIVGFSNVIIDMRDEMDSDELQNCYQLIESNQEQLLTLLDNVMNDTKQADQLKKSMITVTVKSMVDELYQTHSVLVPKHLHFILKDSDSNAKIHVSRTSLRQIVSNLVNNAGKFTEKGSITLGWTADDTHVRIYVEDTGIGLSEEDVENIFGLYFKKDFTTEGAGIGLSLCSKLANAMDGNLSVTSELGKGSRFTLELPRVE